MMKVVGFHDEWINSLKNTILPQFFFSMSSSFTGLLCNIGDIIYRHFQAYDDNDDNDWDNGNNFDKPLAFALAWKNPSEDLVTWVEQIECGFRLMVPTIVCCGRRKEVTKAIEGAALGWTLMMADLAVVGVPLMGRIVTPQNTSIKFSFGIQLESTP
ncbi:hypothetical protein NE237_000293 [Protea cynaroides]|uniref:Uncharacterized protein n=1 Tax=Protea cynaroides TaxID=273540 RepID=A0A9Q0KQX3_9MAGN|nr:hypothetical protein NE237_000293 [Protea cynaroides]